MATDPAPMRPFEGLAAEASATLADCLAAEGLANEAPEVLPAFERAVRAAITMVEANLPDDLPLDFALAYLTGRIAKEQVLALKQARALVRVAHERAEHHWLAAMDAERRRVTQVSPPTTVSSGQD